jgi:hypothetical protein
MGDRQIVVGLRAAVRGMELIRHLPTVWCCERATEQAPIFHKMEFLYVGNFSIALLKPTGSSISLKERNLAGVSLLFRVFKPECARFKIFLDSFTGNPAAF